MSFKLYLKLTFCISSILIVHNTVKVECFRFKRSMCSSHNCALKLSAAQFYNYISEFKLCGRNSPGTCVIK